MNGELQRPGSAHGALLASVPFAGLPVVGTSGSRVRIRATKVTFPDDSAPFASKTPSKISPGPRTVHAAVGGKSPPKGTQRRQRGLRRPLLPFRIYPASR
jgi:hypothetical protein